MLVYTHETFTAKTLLLANEKIKHKISNKINWEVIELVYMLEHTHAHIRLCYGLGFKGLVLHAGTLNPKPYTLNPKPYTLNPTP